MREILFRGKRIDNGEWAYGDIAHIEDRVFASYYNNCELKQFINDEVTSNNITLVGVFPFVEVIPETVGQYTGLNDKNGKKIFEGDIITDPDVKINHLVTFDEGGFGTEKEFLQAFLCFGEMEVEVIGNIHDNPELLEVE